MEGETTGTSGKRWENQFGFGILFCVFDVDLLIWGGLTTNQHDSERLEKGENIEFLPRFLLWPFLPGKPQMSSGLFVAPGAA